MKEITPLLFQFREHKKKITFNIYVLHRLPVMLHFVLEKLKKTHVN